MEGKKRHSTAANVLYLLRHVTKADRTYLSALTAALAVKLALPVVATLLPTAAVAALTRGGSMGQYLAAILGLMALYALGTALSGYLTQVMGLKNMRFRARTFVPVQFRKALTMDFCLLESPEGQKKAATASAALYGNNVGVEGMLRHLEPWLLNLTGMVLYGAAAVRLDWRILLVLLAMTGANYLIAYWAWCFNIRLWTKKPVRRRAAPAGEAFSSLSGTSPSFCATALRYSMPSSPSAASLSAFLSLRMGMSGPGR